MQNGVAYVPILTGKVGEFAALRRLDPAVRTALRPVLDIAPVADDADAAKVLEKLVAGIGGSLGNTGHVAVDLLALEGRQVCGTDAVDRLLFRAEWGAARVQLAVRTDASDAYVNRVAAERHRAAGLCIRVQVLERGDPATASASVDRMLDALSASPSDVHLVFDCGTVRDWSAAPHEIVRRHVDARADLDEFALVSMAATNVPKTIERDDPPMRVQRREWTSWQRVADRGVVFGDYGVTGPRPLAPPTGRPDPHLRYTTDSALLLWRGRAPDRVTEEDEGRPLTFGDLCRLLIAHEDYAGPDFSDGDAILSQIALRQRANDGGPPGWVEWATGHHLTHVVRALTGT